MEIVYDGTGSLQIKFDDGRELDLDEILNLDKALTLTRTSREWNRKRVVELEDELERGGRKLERGPGNLFTSDEVAHYQSTEAALVADPLRRRIAELERVLAREVNRNTDLEAQVEEADRRITALTGQVKGYDHDRHTEKERADRERRRASELKDRVPSIEEDLEAAERYQAERAEEARRSVAARDQLLAAATTRVQAAREILGATAVGRARDEIVTSKGAVLADAIGNALRALEG
jgi:DNA repair exonuclease SbcCD ATPase subunit